jgi:hypothetical protein
MTGKITIEQKWHQQSKPPKTRAEGVGRKYRYVERQHARRVQELYARPKIGMLKG